MFATRFSSCDGRRLRSKVKETGARVGGNDDTFSVFTFINHGFLVTHFCTAAQFGNKRRNFDYFGRGTSTAHTNTLVNICSPFLQHVVRFASG